MTERPVTERTGPPSGVRGVLVVLVVLVLVLLAGCARLPQPGAVVPGPSDVAPDAAPRVLAEGPRPGAGPESLVEAFLRASAALEDDYLVARSFLTRTAASTWRPAAGTAVYTPGALVVDDGIPAGREDVDGTAEAPDGTYRTLRVRAPVEGTVDEAGRWTSSPAGTSRDVEIGVVQTDGEWRIASLPDEVLLGRDVFTQLYRPYQLYFLDPTQTVLVPETRWFPGRSPTATLLVGELLAGPSPWLSGAVGTAFPPGARLSTQPAAVPLDGEGTAFVDLTPQAQGAGSADRALMQEQLSATLRPVPGVRSVTIAVDGSPLDMPPLVGALERDPLVAGAPVGLLGDEVVRLEGAGPEPVEGLGDLAGRGPQTPAVDGAGDLYAVIVDGRSRLLAGTAEGRDPGLRPVLSGTDLTAPSVDRLGWVWSTSARSGGRVSAARADGEVADVEAGFLAGRRVLSLQVSREGSRAVVVSSAAEGGAHLDVVGVVRQDGRPVRLLAPEQPPLPGLTGAGDAVWVDQSTVAVLGGTGGAVDGEGEGPRLLTVAIDGSSVVESEVPPGATQLTAGRGSRSVLLQTGDGQVLQRAGSAWVPRPGSDGVRDPSYPG